MAKCKITVWAAIKGYTGVVVTSIARAGLTPIFLLEKVPGTFF